MKKLVGGGALFAAVITTALVFGAFSNGRGREAPAVTASGLAAVTYTTADQTYYVDPTGSDSTACTGTGTSACLTIQGALNKSPKLLRHQLTVNVAAGNYAGATISGFTVDPSVQRATAGILIDGALANVVPTTGSATGTATAGTAGASTTSHSTMTDGAATWTVNDPAMVGKFLVFTGGTGSGQVRVIISNTATVITMAGTGTAAVNASTTYAIQSPSVNITSTAAAIPGPTGATDIAAAGLQVLNDNIHASQITIRNIGIAGGSSGGALVYGAGSFVRFLQTIATSTASTAIRVDRGARIDVSVTTASANSAGFAALRCLDAVMVVSSAYLVSSGGSNAAGATYDHCSGTFNNTHMAVTSGAQGVQVYTAASVTSTGFNSCDCNSGSLSACMRTGISTLLGDGAGAELRLSGNVSVTNCTYGAHVSAGSLVGTGIFTGNALTYGINAVYGGNATTATGSTLTAGTAEIAVDDGAASNTFASLTAPFNCLNNLSTGSKVCRK